MEGREPDGRPANWTARVFAAVALLGTAAVIVAVVGASVDDSDSGRERPERDPSAKACRPAAAQAVDNGYYVLEPGEDLSVVATKTCTETEELIKLNPDLDPQQLPISACIDLVPDGCKALAEG